MPIAADAIDPYVRSVIFARMAEVGLPVTTSYVRRDELKSGIVAVIEEWVRPYSERVANSRSYLASELFDTMLEADILVEDGDELAGFYYCVRRQNVKSFAQHKLAEDQIYARHRRIGDKYLVDVFFKYDRDHYIDINIEPLEIPASDRVVLLSDNQPEMLQIREAAKELALALQSANDVGDFTADELAAASAEMNQLVSALEGASVRLAYIAIIAPKVLKWISEKAAGAAVGKGALYLLNLIAAFFGLYL